MTDNRNGFREEPTTARHRKHQYDEEQQTRRKFNWRKYSKKYREDHPEKALQWRINSAVRLLEQHGYIVTTPEDRSLFIERLRSFQQKD